MGRIAAPYGVKGWIKVLPLTSAPETLLTHAQLVGPQAWRRGLLAAACTRSGQAAWGDIAGAVVGSCRPRSGGHALGGDVGVPRAALPAAREGEVYFADLWA